MAKYLLITGDRLPERNIVNKIKHTHLIYIQHGYQSSLKKILFIYNPKISTLSSIS